MRQEQIRAPGAFGGTGDPPYSSAYPAASASVSGSSAGRGGDTLGSAAASPGTGPADRRRRTTRTLSAVLVSIAALAAVVGAVVALSTGNSGRVRVEGPAPTGGSAPASPQVPVRTITPMTTTELAHLVTRQPGIPDSVKDDVNLCGDQGDHVTAQYGDITKSGVNEVLINIRSCADDTGTAVYAFANRYGKDEMVFSIAPIDGVRAAIVKGDIVVSRDETGATPAPSDSKQARTSAAATETVRYSWNGVHFQPVDTDTEDGPGR
ncbi:hypothetical protein BIV57_11690 [Mangrovactinospora gilvigrisea]|uniref:Lipoprotein CseA n=1 Tax=Mangrovactinospora gilvigrisea TaxID=1428644 RepID=A0A1J7CC97_9ACTN|nr:hypothetical protein [Mangrovactinospora gilvigrisea]OIV37306.1 hypothetical protein BIV57_11690 [Mangrovactinospora gilvigrisea]